MAFLAQNLAPLMFATMVVFLLLGYPVAFALAACGVLFGLVGIQLGVLSPALFQALPDRIWGVMSNDTMMAVLFFTFMGLILERSGMAEDLLETIGQMFGPVRGGLAFAVVLVGAMLAATTGVVAASVISMGLISLPIMLRYGYNKQFASGVIAASGTLAQIIPPSLVLIVMADQLGRSVGDMYKGAFIPGFVLTGLYAAYVGVVAATKPSWAPAIPAEARTLREPDGGSGLRSLALLGLLAGALTWYFAAVQGPLRVMQALSADVVTEVATDARVVLCISTWTLAIFGVAALHRLFGLKLLSRLSEQFAFVLMPPMGLIFLVLGTIFLGLATPTAGGAMGAAGALLIALLRKRLNLGLMKQAMESTARLCAFAVFILLGSRVFSLTFYGVDGHLWVEHLLVGLPGGQLGFLVVVNLLVFVLAFFLDYFELSFIIVPLLAPVAEKLGIDLIWFGVLLAINMQTSFMHPPFGFALFFLRSVAPSSVKTSDIYWGAVPFVLIQMCMVVLVIAFPQIVSVGLAGKATADLDKVQITLPQADVSQPSADDLLQRELGGAPIGEPAASAPSTGGAKESASAVSADPVADEITRQLLQGQK